MTNVPLFENNKLEPGDLVVVDAGATYRDYWCDMMRMASIGEPDPEAQRFFDVDLQAQRAGMAKIKPGAKAGDICKACLDVIEDAGVGEHAPSLERVCHGVGMGGHQP